MKPHELIATNTLGMGARPGEIDECRTDPKGWVLAQIENEPSQRASVQRRKTFQGKNISTHILLQDMQLRHEQAVASPASFRERWLRFWCNHFTVSARDKRLKTLMWSYEQEGIRPYIFGDFRSLLRSAVLHPAMIIYLDNNRSIGANSKKGMVSESSHNENLAREILELHTLGLDGGYSLSDIKALALALTGWTVKRESPNSWNSFFKRSYHEPGKKLFLQKTYDSRGRDQALEMLDDLARHKATAKIVATKLVQHFIGGAVSSSAVETLTRVFLETDGDLKALAEALVNLDQVWAQNDWIFKTPEEFLISIGRTVPDWTGHYRPIMTKLLGQPSLRPPSPEGWSLRGDDWINAENILIRAGWIMRALKSLSYKTDADFIFQEALGGHISNMTNKIVRGESDQDYRITLAFMSPEFLRR